MGQDKALMKFGGYDTLIKYQYTRLANIFSNVYISSKNNKFDAFVPTENIILDTDSIYSPMVALKSIFHSINGKVFILTVDTPFIGQKTIETIIQASKDYKLTIAKTKNNTHNLCGVFDTSLIKEVNECLASDIHKIGYLHKVIKSNIVYLDDEREFFNINTFEDYELVNL